jgi:hypothetical protein
MYSIEITANMEETSLVKKYTIEECTFYSVEEVIDYNFCENTFNKWKVNKSDSNKNKEYPSLSNIYMIIDTAFNAGIAHWLYESAVFLSFFKDLQKIHPTIKIHLKINRRFKVIFLQLFNISEADISYSLEENNICYFIPPITSLNIKEILIFHRKYIKNLKENFDSLREEKGKNIDLLILPRQIKDNYNIGFDFSPLSKVISTLRQEGRELQLLNTDDINDIKDQITTIRSAKNIVLIDGAALLINGMFAYNSTIYVVTRNCTQAQSKEYPQMKYLLDLIEKNNKNILLYFDTEEKFLEYYLKT